MPHCEFTDSYVEVSSRSAHISFAVDIPDAVDVQNVGLLVSLTADPSADSKAVSRLAKKSVDPCHMSYIALGEKAGNAFSDGK
ncbi:MAG: hypothetical protein MJY91_06975 [Bacteroidales bacterium]|nr:hypothetical protein [Bacteroidales bacterium]